MSAIYKVAINHHLNAQRPSLLTESAKNRALWHLRKKKKSNNKYTQKQDKKLRPKAAPSLLGLGQGPFPVRSRPVPAAPRSLLGVGRCHVRPAGSGGGPAPPHGPLRSSAASRKAPFQPPARPRGSGGAAPHPNRREHTTPVPEPPAGKVLTGSMADGTTRRAALGPARRRPEPTAASPVLQGGRLSPLGI